MQMKKAEIGKIFEKLKPDARSTKHRYGWFTFEDRKILRVHYSHRIIVSDKQIPYVSEYTS